MRQRLIVFDVDGTLVDSQAHILASISGAFRAVGRKGPARREALSIVGLSLPVAMRRLAPDAPEHEADRMVDAYKATFQQIRMNGDVASPLYDGTREMLSVMKADPSTLLGFATGKSRRGLEHVLQFHSLNAYFATEQVADDHPSKPHPSMLEAACRETGIDRTQAVMVGDTEYDIEMGRAAGFKTVAVTWGYHDRKRLEAADVIIETWSDLPAALETTPVE